MKQTMTKIEEVKVETIESTSQPKGVEKIETIYPEVIEIPTYDYGNSQNTLDYNIALRNKPTNWWLTIQMWSFTITATWSIAITWVWFKPTYVTFSYSASTWKGEWEMTETQMKSYDPRTLTTVTTDNVYIRDWADAVIARTQYVSMDDDWFTLNCSFRTANLTVYYTAFK